MDANDSTVQLTRHTSTVLHDWPHARQKKRKITGNNIITLYQYQGIRIRERHGEVNGVLNEQTVSGHNL